MSHNLKAIYHFLYKNLPAHVKNISLLRNDERKRSKTTFLSHRTLVIVQNFISILQGRLNLSENTRPLDTSLKAVVIPFVFRFFLPVFYSQSVKVSPGKLTLHWNIRMIRYLRICQLMHQNLFLKKKTIVGLNVRKGYYR